MNEVGPVGRITTLLEEAGYKTVEQFAVAGITFDLGIALAGQASLDLIVVIDLLDEDDEERVRRSIEALARALDLVSSRRSLTVILVGPRPKPALFHAISAVARTLTVPPGEDDAAVHDALAVLLPLRVEADEGRDVGGEWAETRELMAKTNPAEIEPVLEAAQAGGQAVNEALQAVLAQALQGLEDENQEEMDK